MAQIMQNKTIALEIFIFAERNFAALNYVSNLRMSDPMPNPQVFILIRYYLYIQKGRYRKGKLLLLKHC